MFPQLLQKRGGISIHSDKVEEGKRTPLYV